MKKPLKILSFISALTVFLTSLSVPAMALSTETGEERQKYGDVNLDGQITSSDALEILLNTVGKISFSGVQTKFADVTGKNTVDSADALCVLRYAVGEFDIFPRESDIELNSLYTVKGWKNKISYTFTGAHRDDSGFACGRIDFLDKTEENTKFTLYWADDSKLLPDYYAIDTVIPAQFPDGYIFNKNLAIPEGAKSLVLFSENTENPYETNIVIAYDKIALPSYKLRTDSTKSITFASVSDMHMNYTGAFAANKWTNALNYFADENIDYVIGSGDMTGSGTAAEYQTYVNAIAASSYPAGQIYEARGNHDSTQNENFIKYTSGAGEEHPFENSPWFSVFIEGKNSGRDSIFIFMAQELSETGGTAICDNFSDGQLDWVENLLKKYAGTNTDIFVVEHAMTRNWGPGDRVDGYYTEPMLFSDSFPGNLRFKSLMCEYKEAIVMTGHTHLSFTEGINFSDNNGTSARIIHNSSVSRPRIYEPDGTIINDDNSAEEAAWSECYIASVYDNAVVYEATDLIGKMKYSKYCYALESYDESRKSVKSITIAKLPTRTAYTEGEFFDDSGLIVRAKFTDGSAAFVAGYSLNTKFSLTSAQKTVTVSYGGASAEIPITVTPLDTDFFAGSGTYESPYLISGPQDFAVFTKLMESSAGTDSHDTNVFGKNLFFLQTADIDMTDFPGYRGTNACGTEKYGFSGVYDGAGHKLKVCLSRSDCTDLSVFPYLNGAIINLAFTGSITGTGSMNIQPVRTVGQNGLILNCSADLSLYGGSVSGITKTLYGTLCRCWCTGSFTGNNACPAVQVLSNDGLTGICDLCYYNVSFSNPSAADTSVGTFADPETVNILLGDTVSNAVDEAVYKLKCFDEAYTTGSLCDWSAGGKLSHKSVQAKVYFSE